MNLSIKLGALQGLFGKDQIENFVKNQLSAGKDKYNEDCFFEALSEISILCFLCHIVWTKYIYEPVLNKSKSKKNPEARFEFEKGKYKYAVNVEVKSPAFPHNNHENQRIIIPTVLLSEKGKKTFSEYCMNNGLELIWPRVLKIKDFLNSASEKFIIPVENEYNLLYINWSYSDFPSNSYLEAWSLMTNPINGILTHPEYAKQIGINDDIFDKISAVIVYTESLEGVMFQSFEHVWQNNSSGPRFRMWINNKMYNNSNSESSKISDLCNITCMNPSPNASSFCMCDFKNDFSNYNPQELLKLIIDTSLK